MPTQQKPAETSSGSAEWPSRSPPTISLPKGGGAIRGVGEKFAANPVTGTGSMTVPIATSPGRSGFGPQLALSYDSGAGNGPYGFGWSLSLPSITRKTDKGLPKYEDGDESDVFILSGAEDLVPVFKANQITGEFVKDAKGNFVCDEFPRDGYVIRRYRPRIEGLFARIERWTNATDATDVFWRSISKDNITTFYGKTEASRIANPEDPSQIFSWLICQSYDDKGNAIVYKYKAETSDGIDLAQAHEKNRTALGRSANRYLKGILYGNRTPNRSLTTWQGTDPAQLPDSTWMFEVVFDYEDGHYQEQQPDANGRIFAQPTIAPSPNSSWPVREDPFSSYRAGFEVRTYRLCRRVLVFHHFPDELGTADYLVRSTEFTYDQSPIASFITAITQSGYVRQANGNYLKKSLPPVEFQYSEATINEEVQDVDPESLQNLPVGADGGRYQWLDLDGEGLQSVLAEQEDGWYYKRNVSPLSFTFVDGKPTSTVQFDPVTEVATLPSFAETSVRRHQFLDLAGDGLLDCVVLERPVAGFFERTHEQDWDVFKPLQSLPNLDWSEPNLRFVDLTGDGHADILITENEALVWHPALEEEGFGEAIRIRKPRDEEKGPVVAFADAAQAVFLADLSGDGLSDIARIRNGEVCYWPNLGYGRFGAKVTMDNSPWFDAQDQFDQERVRLADIDGSGTTDVIYLHRDGLNIYRNRCGNGWSDVEQLSTFPAVNNVTSVQAVDLLGNGTACLVWTSPLPGDSSRPMLYIDLMGGQKPHLLIKTVNNLGAETVVQYAPSMKFYLQDNLDGKPWITRLPFPVHCVERVETYDRISGNRFVSRYVYHHGYFDGVEREFRGFGMVEQFDTEEIGTVGLEDTSSEDVTNWDVVSFVPPVHTKTWFHTGTYLGRQHVSDFFAGLLDANDKGEYYREPGLTDDQARALLLEDSVLPEGLTIDEEREACRALKGSMLRQEIYALDGTPKAAHPYTVTEQNFTIKRLQPQGPNQHPVFLTHPREALSYHYERNPDDPRIGHTMTLEVDDCGNVERSLAIGYPRRSVPDRRPEQADTHMTLTVNRVVNHSNEDDWYRSGLPVETQTYEMVKPPEPSVTATSIERFGFDAIRALTKLLFPLDQTEPDLANTWPYEKWDWRSNAANAPGENRLRLIERIRTLYRRDDLTGVMLLGQAQSLALPFESYKLAFTADLLAKVYERPLDVVQTPGSPQPENLLPNAADVLGGQGPDQGGYVHLDNNAHWWIPSGRMFFSPSSGDTPTDELAHAREHFFLPRRFRDPFGEETLVSYDTDDTNPERNHNLLVVKTEDALGNVVTVTTKDDTGSSAIRIDYRVLQPYWVTDPNGNRTRVAFDTLGMVVASAVTGKPPPALVEGDSLDDFAPDLTDTVVLDHLAHPLADPHAILAKATTRLVYDLFAYQRTKDQPNREPAVVYTLTRETHHAKLTANEQTKIQHGFSYSDGFGREIQKKIQAEPDKINGLAGPPRWVGSGWTIFNNKGKPVRQYEPFFSALPPENGHKFEFGVLVGVSPVLFYDPAERVVATLHPNHTWEKVVFDPWRQETWDVNETALAVDPKTDADVGDFFSRLPDDDYLPTWHALRTDPAHAAEANQRWPDPAIRNAEKEAAEETAVHANTPTAAHFDTLGRTFLTVAHNRFKYSDTPAPDPPVEEFYPTRVVLDIEGTQREVIDAKDRVVMRYDYDMLGNRIHQLSMETGARWMLNDVAGKPIRAWDSRGHNFTTTYDALRRPVEQTVRGTIANGEAASDARTLDRDILVDKIEYGESLANVEALNLRTRIYRHFDSAGVATNARLDANGSPIEAYDFKGNLLRSTRHLARDYTAIPDWLQPAEPQLDAEFFEGSTRYDALNRPIQSITPHTSLTRPQHPNKINVIQPVFNEANLLDRVDVWLERAVEPAALLDSSTMAPSSVGVANIDYDAKGQRQRIDYKNGASTLYSYEPLTFRLTQLVTRRNAAAFPNDDPQSPVTGWPGRQVQNLHYTYDPAGNITHIQDDAQQTIYFRNKRVEPSNDYVYDALHRLIQADGREHLGQLTSGERKPPTAPDGFNAFHTRLDHPGNGQAMGTYTERYVYDAVGNFLQIQHRGSDPVHAGWTRAYEYLEPSLTEDGSGGTQLKTSNRLTRTTLNPNGVNPPQVEAYQHDAHGNMVRMPHLGGGLPGSNMHWDYKDQLRQTDLGGGGAAWYVYGASGQRVRKVWEKAPGLTEERIYLGGFEIFRTHGGPIGANTATLERETLHVMDDKQRIALVETRTLDTVGDDPAPRQLIRYQFGNHLGSASLELDDQAQIISYEEYSPYGNSTYQAVRSQTETAKRYRYTGKERDSETGFHFHGARYYATWLGKWLSCDPLGLVDGLSLFTYVSCNPVRLNDPTGRQQAALCNIDPQHPAAVVCTPVQEKAADEVLEVTVHGPKRGSKEREAELKEMQGSAKSGTPSPPVNVPTPVKGGNDGIPLWMAWQRPDFWSGQVDPRAINDFNEGVNRNAVPLVGALTLGALQLGILGGLEYGGGALVFSRNFASALGNYTGVTPLVNGVRVAADILTSSSGGIGFGTRLWLAMNMGTAEAMGWGALGGGAVAASGGGGSSGGGSSSQGYMPSHQRVPAITYGSYQDRGGLDISVPRTIYVVDGKAYYVTSGQAMRLPGQLDKGTGNAFRIWGIQESTDGPIKAGWVGKQTILGGGLSPAPSAAQNSVVLDFHGNLSNPADVNAWLRQQGVDAQGSIPNQWQF